MYKYLTGSLWKQVSNNKMALVSTSFKEFQTSPILSYQRENFAKCLDTWAFYIFRTGNSTDNEKEYAAKQRMILISYSKVLQTSMDIVRQLFYWFPYHEEKKLKEFISRIDFLWKRLGKIVESVILAATGLELFSIDGWSLNRLRLD